MAAAVIESAAVRAAQSETGNIVSQLMKELDKPLYSNLTTTTVTRINKKGHTTTKTTVKGYQITTGLVVGGGALIALWEVGLAIAQAWNKSSFPIKGAAEAIASGVQVAFDVQGVIVGLATFNYAQATSSGQAALTAAWDYLDGQGSVHPAAPATAASVVSLPSTGMASLSQLLANAVSIVGVPLQAKLPDLLNKLLNSASVKQLQASGQLNPTIGASIANYGQQLQQYLASRQPPPPPPPPPGSHHGKTP